jgi:hypothetical protein
MVVWVDDREVGLEHGLGGFLLLPRFYGVVFRACCRHQILLVVVLGDVPQWQRQTSYLLLGYQ